MKKIILLILTIINSICFAQDYQWQNNLVHNSNEIVRSLSFINPNTGWVGLEIDNTNAWVFKTTNKGNSFSRVFNYLDYSTSNMSYDIGVNFINESTGFISTGDRIFKTINGGNNWNSVYTFPSMNGSSAIKFVNANTGYAAFSIPYNYASLYKTTNGGANWFLTCINHDYSNNVEGVFITDIATSSSNPNTAAICGYYKSVNLYNKTSFIVKSTDGFISTSFGGSYNDVGLFSHVYLLPNDELRVFGEKGIYSPNIFGSNLIFDMGTTDDANRQTGFSFSNQNLGFAASYDGKIWRTTNSGINYINEANTGIHYPLSSRMNSFNEIAYFGANGNFFTRLLKSNLSLNGETGMLTTNDKIKFDFVEYSNGQDQYLRGGYSNLQSNNVLNSGTPNEMIFYKWHDNKMVNVNPDYYFDYPHDIKAYYKTKQKSTDETAIANVNQTKAVRGSNGEVYQIHSSIGGIFFTVGSQPNLEFTREEVVNGGQLYSQQFPNENTADNNKNPSINEIKYFNQENSAPAAFGLTAVWERYDQPANKTDVLCALRSAASSLDNPWTRFGNNLNLLDGKIISFISSSGYNSKPEIYSLYMDGSTSDVRNFLMIIPHLEPAANGNKLVVSARYQNFEGFDYEALRLGDPDIETKDFKIIPDYVTDYSVTYTPLIYNNQKAVFMYFTYKKNGSIYYRRELIYLSIYNEIIRAEIPENEREFNLSNIDGQSECNTPDITLRNGMPTITYQGKYDANREVSYENNTNGPTVPLHYYPIFIKMRNSSGEWISYYYNSNGFQTQENPDIEGSTNYDAFVINYSKAKSSFYQFVNISGFPRYYCNPGVFNGKDAKFIKGSYSGQFGSSSYPGLLTLSNQTGSLYDIGKQPFTINPYNIGTDGFSNLDGTIEKNNTLYSLTLGPIIASNTTYGFEDGTPPQTVQNPAEFNESMVSSVFYLSNNDTLIIGANGQYKPSGSLLQHLKYHVNLVNSNSGQIHRELFRDTINTEDSVGIEFLRGYVISNVAKGTDQFYVQMIVDTVDAVASDYGMSGVYADNTPPQGDASHGYKTKVFFESGPNPLTNNIGSQLPKDYALSQNYPNPFNPSTTIKFALPKDGFVTMKVYDISGREVARLVNEVKKAGYHDVLFNASNLASGVYFYRIQSNDFVMTKRMVLIK